MQAVAARKPMEANGQKPPLLLKISPDLTEQQQKDIAAIVNKKQVCIEAP